MRYAKEVILLCCLLLFLGNVGLYADDHSTHDHEGHHQHALNEIGVSLGYFYLDHDEESAAGLHLHYMRRLRGEGIREHLGLGVGFETIFADAEHYNPMVTLGIYPWRNLTIEISPGILLVKDGHEGHEGEGHEGEEHENHFSLHVETGYGFHVGDFELGPVLGYSQAGEDRHFSLGLHFGIGF